LLNVEKLMSSLLSSAAGADDSVRRSASRGTARVAIDGSRGVLKALVDATSRTNPLQSIVIAVESVAPRVLFFFVILL